MKHSQSKQILEWLQSGKSITQIEATVLFRCTRLAARILDLKEDGHIIASVREKHEGGFHKRYSLVGAA